MSLPWFPFNIKDFLANTLRLNTEAKGAYLCLMLDYYQGEQALPDDDDVLASIAGLTPESWERHRKVLAPLFDIRDGYWYHTRIAEEIERGRSKLATSKAKATAASAAMHAKAGHKKPSSQPQAGYKPKDPSKPASSQPEAVPEASPTSAHLTLTSTLSSERVDARAKQGAVADSEGKLPGTFLDPNWSPDPAGIEFARSNGMATDEIIKSELLLFHDRCLEDGRVSNDWNASWRRWCARYLEIHPPPPPPPAPRVDVNASATVPDAASMHRSYELALQRWITDESGWPRQLGLSPGSINCRVPRELLDQYNIDPKTGQVIRPSTRKEAS